jgi:hypothetical protein
MQFFAPANQEGFTGGRPNLNVEANEDGGAMSQDEVKAYLEERAFQLKTYHEQSEKQFEITRSEPTTLAGQPDWKMQYTFESLIDGQESANMEVMAGIADRTYLLTFSTPTELFDEFLPDVQHMINSFRVEE